MIEHPTTIDAIARRIERVLPGWMIRVQWCGLSAEAWVAPDLNNPACAAEFRDNPGRWHNYAEENEVEINPGSREAAAQALLEAFARAIEDTTARRAA